MVHKVVPVSVKAGDGAAIDADEKGLERLLAESGEHRSQESDGNRDDAGGPVQSRCAV